MKVYKSTTAATWVRRGIVSAVFVGAASWPIWGAMLTASADDHEKDGAVAEAPATDEQAMDEQAMMAAMIKAGTPGEMQAMLETYLAGNWKATGTMQWQGEEMTMPGKASAEMIMGGRILKETYEGNFMGQPFQGMSLTAYDNATGTFQSLWIDEMSTGMYYSTGKLSDDGKTLVMNGLMPEPMSGQFVESRYELVLDSEDKHTMKMSHATEPGGEMVPAMTLVYERAE